MKDITLLDGGFATQLQLPPFNKDLSGHLWSAQCIVDDPNAVRAIHQGYVEAGADIICTASYQLSLEGLQKSGLSLEASKNVCCQSIRLAHSSKGERTQVALSLGPYGATLANGSEYTGNYDTTFLASFHRKRLELFMDEINKIDILLFETIPSLAEAQQIAQAIMDLPKPLKNLPVWISFSCKFSDSTGKMNLSNGQDLRESIEKLIPLNVFSAFGVNCTKFVPKDSFLHLLSQLRQTLNNQITPNGEPIAALVYPDGGATWDAETREWSSETVSSKQYAKEALSWIETLTGIPMIIGGCCGTSKDHIREVSMAIKTITKS